jgi:cell division protease FtsH
MSSIKSLFGGRLAELIIFGADNVTTGASNDIERATEMARNMVTKWGLSDKLGPLTYQEEEGEVFLGRSMNRHREVSEETVQTIDSEVRAIIDTCYKAAEKILRENMDTLHLMSNSLMKYETIDESQIKEIMQGKEATAPEGWQEFKDSPAKDTEKDDKSAAVNSDDDDSADEKNEDSTDKK